MKKKIVILLSFAIAVVIFTICTLQGDQVVSHVFLASPIGLLVIGNVVRAKERLVDIKPLLKNVDLLDLEKDEFSKPTVLKYAIIVALGVLSEVGYIPRFSELLRMINKAAFRITKGALKTYLNSLEKNGYIKLVREGYVPGEGYVTKIQLTEKGKMRYRELINQACKNHLSPDKVIETYEGGGNHG